ncbi:MAG TPA: hypothetical protein VFP46_01230 [Candidatus Paceibacterota bacterium]|nr:hypothetical protein [Candidatus Paceibacterota bacterium]
MHRAMSRINTLIVFGLLVMLDPFSGLPIALRTLLQIAFGAVILGIALSMRAEESRKLHAPVEPAEGREPALPEPPQSISPI